MEPPYQNETRRRPPRLERISPLSDGSLLVLVRSIAVSNVCLAFYRRA